MGLRHILMVLSLLTVLSVSVGGTLYYSALHRAAFQEAERQAAAKTELIQKSVTTFLSEHQNTVATLAGMPACQETLMVDTADTRYRANVTLDHFAGTLNADVCYLMNRQGLTIASSNRNAPDSFVGKNFSFRPYFKQAMQGTRGTYLAMGVTSRKRGVYHSFPIYSDPEDQPVGVAVIKSSIDKIENELGLPDEDIVLITDPLGVIFITNRPHWLYQLAWKPSPEQLEAVALTRQFGSGPWQWVGLQMAEEGHVSDREGNRYLLHHAHIDRFPGWQIIYLRSTRAIARTVTGPLLGIVGPAALLLSLFIGTSVLVLYRKASREIFQRRSAEEALRVSEERYRALYHHTPAMLHSIDQEGNLLSVSDFWTETMGYTREEVLGRPLTDFFTPDSREYAQTIGIPQFFRKGFIKEVLYKMVKKSGEIIDVSLSAIADRDETGRIQRSLAVSIDVTERNRAEAALRIATQELSQYSKALEVQVQKRTEQLRHLSGSIMASQENERAAIARELHDELGQLLTALRMDAVWLEKRLGEQDGPAAERAAAMASLVDTTIEEVRAMSIRLRPGVLDDLGLVEALEWFTSEFERRAEIACIFSHDPMPVVPDAIATAAYRIAQEALTNVARHAATATRAEVELRMRDDTLTLTVSDDGRGFDPTTLAETKQLGLVSMRERAVLVNGTLTVTSAPGNGTVVTLKVPLERQEIERVL